jgi:hypothetical protein
MGRCPNLYLFISFACPKEMNQRKRQPQIFFGINILEAAHAIQLVVLRPPQTVLLTKGHSLRSLQNVTLFPKKIWWHCSPYGDKVLIGAIYINTEINHEFILVTNN